MGKIKNDNHEKNLTKLTLIIIALHSFIAGSILILSPVEIIQWFGLSIPSESFYSVQGGVLLCIMSIGYLMIGLKYAHEQRLVLLASIAKFIGAIFVFICYFFIEGAWIVLASAITDLLMGFILAWDYIDISLDFKEFEFDLFDIDANYIT
jgi:hypothetical protein